MTTAVSNKDASGHLHETTGPDVSGRETVAEETSLLMPEDLAAKIIARLPFPNIFQARLLSRFWHMQLSSDSCCSSSSFPSSPTFLSEVKAMSEQWGSYCPLVLNNADRWLAGYDAKSNSWRKFREVSFAPSCVEAVAGCLLCGLFVDAEVRKTGVFRVVHVRVANVLIGGWKHLPRRANMEDPFYLQMFSTTFDSYKLFLATTSTDQSYPSSIVLQIYDSALNSWCSLKQFKVVNSSRSSVFSRKNRQIFFNNRFYLMYGCLATFGNINFQYEETTDFLSYNLDDETVTQLPTPFSEIFRNKINWYKFLICGSDLMVVISLYVRLTLDNSDVIDYVMCDDESESRPNLIGKNRLMVFNLDLDSHELREVSRGPPEDVWGPSASDCVTHGNRIFFGGTSTAPGSTYVVYSVADDEWGCLSLPTEFFESEDGCRNHEFLQFGFQPGLNPFLQV